MEVDTNLDRNFEVQGFKLMLMGMPLGEPFKDNEAVHSDRNTVSHKIAVGQDEPEILNVVGYVSTLKGGKKIWITRDTFGEIPVYSGNSDSSFPSAFGLGTSARSAAREFLTVMLQAADGIQKGMVAIGGA